MPKQSTRSRNGQPKTILRRDGRFVARLDVPSNDGLGTIRKDFYGHSAQEAEARRDAARVALARGEPLGDRRTSLATVADRWLDAVEPPNPTHRCPEGLVHSTWIGYEAHVRLHIAPYLGQVKLGQLSKSQVDAWQRRLVAAGMGATMRGKVLQTLRTLLDWAIDEDMISRNGAKKSPMPGAPPPRWKPIDLSELDVILSAIDGHRLHAHFLLALTMGPRMGEINGLGLEDYDAEARTLTINHTLSWATGQPDRHKTKTPKSQRTIYLPQVVVEALDRHLEQREHDRIAAGQKWVESAMLFTRKNGASLRGDGTGGVGDQFKRCLVRAGLAARNFHQLRHHAATLLLALNGGDYFEVAQILGHSTFRLTLDLYGHLIPEIQRERAADLDEFYSGRLGWSGSGDGRVGEHTTGVADDVATSLMME